MLTAEADGVLLQFCYALGVKIARFAGVVVATLPANGECPQGLWGLGSDRNMVCFDNLSVRPLGK